MRPASTRVEAGLLGERWELVSVLADGSLSTIYAARPAARPDAPACYAIKILRKRWESWGHAVELLRREYIVGRSVMHPHLITALEAGLRHPPFYLVMPRLHGMTLEELLRRHNCLSLPSVLWIVRQTAEALAALDKAGWIHGDIKPSNILVSSEGHVTLLDLGFARRPQEESSAVDRCILGTVAYLAPELVLSRRGADIRSDIYSLGVLLARACAGDRLLDVRSLSDLATLHRRGEFMDIQRIAPYLPRPMRQLVQQMTAKDPLRRPQTPGLLIERLVHLEIDTFGHHTTSV